MNADSSNATIERSAAERVALRSCMQAQELRACAICANVARAKVINAPQSLPS